MNRNQKESRGGGFEPKNVRGIFRYFSNICCCFWKRIKRNDNISWIGTKMKAGRWFRASSLQGFSTYLCIVILLLVFSQKNKTCVRILWSVYTLAIEFETSGGRVVSSLNTFAFRYFKYYQKHYFFHLFFQRTRHVCFGSMYILAVEFESS